MDRSIGMIGISGKPSTKLFSHNAGWTDVLQSLTGAEIITDPTDIHKYDKLIINEGLNYKENKWNFIGGVSQYTHDILFELIDYDGTLVSYNEKIDLNYLINKRKDFDYIDKEIVEYKEVELLRTDKNYDKLIVGDSHSVSIYRPGYGISRNDGKTLHGFLKDPYSYLDMDASEFVLYFGNIDMRFHIARQKDPMDAIHVLVCGISDLAWKLKEQGKKVTLQELLPIEDESRKIPGTGLYNKQPYFGSRSDRQHFVDEFNRRIRENGLYYGFNVQAWTNLPLDGFEAPKFPAMESRQSVHLRPQYYLHGEKFINNETNRGAVPVREQDQLGFF